MAVVVFALNIENLTTHLGADNILVRWLPIISSGWVLYPASLVLGAGLAPWVDSHLRRKEAEQALEELYAEGVANRNRLVFAVADYDDAAERAKLEEWGDRVLSRLREAGVGIGARSSFKTLNLYNAQFRHAAGKTVEQEHVESIWTEKLNRLATILNKLDA